MTVHGHKAKRDQCLAVCDVPEIITISSLSGLLFKLEQLNVCPGHPDPHFVAMANSKMGSLTSLSGDIAEYVDRNCAIQLNRQTYSETVRSTKCHLLISTTKCLECVSYRNVLRAMYSMYHRWLKRQNESPSQITSMHSHANERWQNTPQRRRWLSS